jgi:UMF1 family MFS transporter
MVKSAQHKKAQIAWCLYDWANSAFPTVIITFIFSVYFGRSVIGDATIGSVWWSYALSFSGMLIAIFAPLMGAMADHYKYPKRLFIWFSWLCMGATALLWFAAPASGLLLVFAILALVIFANFGFEMAQIFYNAQLPKIAHKEQLGRLSGWGWGLGYAGGLTCLCLTLFGFVGLGEIKPLLSLPTDNAAHIRITAPLTALWFLIFSAPLFLILQEPGGTAKLDNIEASLRKGAQELLKRLKAAKKNKPLFLFLIASAVYRDGLNTLFIIGGIYAAGTFGMSFQEILIFALGLNISAGIGAALFAFADDKIGPKRTIIISLICLIITGTVIMFTGDKTVFMITALALGIFIGPVQAASRTLAAKLSVQTAINQTFGLYAFTGKSIAFMGPLAFGVATAAFENQRAGIATILLFLIAGLVILSFVKEKQT